MLRPGCVLYVVFSWGEGWVINYEVSCDWRFQPPHTLLKQEGLQLAEASFRDICSPCPVVTRWTLFVMKAMWPCLCRKVETVSRVAVHNRDMSVFVAEVVALGVVQACVIICPHWFVWDATNWNCPFTTMVSIFIAGTTFQKSMPSFRGKHSTHDVGIAGCNTSFFLLNTGALARLPHAMLSCVTCNSMWHARSLVALQAVHNASPPQCSTLPAWHSTLLQSTLETLRNFALHTPQPWHFDTFAFACYSPHYFTLCTLQFPLHT